MNIEKINCPLTNGLPDAKKCHEQLKILFPNMLSCLHENNNHVLIDIVDYDNKGHVKAISVTQEVNDNIDLSFKPKFEKIKQKEFV